MKSSALRSSRAGLNAAAGGYGPDRRVAQGDVLPSSGSSAFSVSQSAMPPTSIQSRKGASGPVVFVARIGSKAVAWKSI